MGNVRIVFTSSFNDAQEQPDLVTIVQENHYYPFGMQINGDFIKKQSVKNDYLYNGKELNTEIGLNWSDYGARFYDPVVGRFVSVDPFAVLYPSIAPPVYVANNPVNFVDPDGQFIAMAVGTIVGGASGALKAYNNGTDVWAGAGEGAVAGGINRCGNSQF